MDCQPKVPWNLSVNPEIKREMATYCAAIGRDVSEVTEELYVEVLKKAGVKVRTQKKRKGGDLRLDNAIRHLNRFAVGASLLGYVAEGLDHL